ncbi:MAG: undecaprenyl-phosphate glucose phosphotransferase [Polymorphobacter sp.]|uniref:undecaprenyl-phosphate glucose phosphotransferase n=1 Tax=Polymorphobacter sp. TaxID=1909290 RepID=UPI003A89CD38
MEMGSIRPDKPVVQVSRAGSVPSGRPGVPLELAVLLVRVLEFAAALASGFLAASFAGVLEGEQLALYGRAVLLGALCFATLAETMGCYDLDAQFSLRTLWRRLAASWALTALFLITLGFLLKVSGEVSRGWALVWFGGGGGTLLLGRAVSTVWVRRLKNRGTFNQRVAIFGASVQGERFAQYVLGNPRLTISLVGFFDDRARDRVMSAPAGLPLLGNLTQLITMIREGKIDQVVVALPWSADARLQQVVSRLALTPVRIRLAPDMASFAFAKRPMVLLGDLPVMTVFERPISGMDAVLKRAEDLMLTMLIMLVAAPVMALTALAVKLDSPGPVLFRQPREGFNNKPFEVLKFRSMYVDHGQRENIEQASRHDPRVTRVGRFIRRTSIDELPQLLNVLKGDMSLVGPRPHAPSTRAGDRLFSEVVASYAARHKVKPGITGWAQVCGWRGETDTEAKLVKRLEHDLHYIENWSLGFDIYILVRTLGAVVLNRDVF